MTYTSDVNYEEALSRLIAMLDGLERGERKRVAEECGVTPGYVTHIIKGRKRPTPELQSKLLRAMRLREVVEFVRDGDA